jgi:uncharacterized membrane protein YedE/YeeE
VLQVAASDACTRGAGSARRVLYVSGMSLLTLISALAGGGLIGLAASVLLIASGRVSGISGILGGLLVPTRGDTLWRVLFTLGLLAAGGVAAYVFPHSLGSSPRSLPLLAAAGLLVGVGTRLGNGCTSGHGVCGISRLSPRSLLATLTFIATGMLVVRLISVLGVV